MKYLLISLLSFSFLACKQRTEDINSLQYRMDSLEMKLDDAYKPGFGEFMSGIQAHHSKLWFAGQNENWKLADFEIHEIMESINGIRKYQSERNESKLIGMIDPAIDSVSAAIQQKNPALFISSYTFLTNSCNNCHRSAGFEFNVVKIPTDQPYSNQDFKTKELK